MNACFCHRPDRDCKKCHEQSIMEWSTQPSPFICIDRGYVGEDARVFSAAEALREYYGPEAYSRAIIQRNWSEPLNSFNYKVRVVLREWVRDLQGAADGDGLGPAYPMGRR